MADLLEILTSAGINLATALGFLVAFALLRLQPINDRVYFPKWYRKGIRGSPTSSGTFAKRFVNLDAMTYIKFLNWMPAALRMPEPELIDHAGLDSAAYIRIYVLGLKIFFPITVLSLAVLIPLNYTNDTLEKFKEVEYSDIDKISISNVPNASLKFIGHLILSYVFSIWTCFVLYHEYKTVATKRLQFLASQKRRPDQFSVLVRNVPPDPDESVSEHIEHFFCVNHPNDYLTHQVVYNTNKLAKLVARKKSLKNRFVYYQNKYERNPDKSRPTTKTGFLGLLGDKVDAIDYYTTEIEKLSEEHVEEEAEIKKQPDKLYNRINLWKVCESFNVGVKQSTYDKQQKKRKNSSLTEKKERERVASDPEAIMPAAFVSFKSRWGAAVCAQTQQSSNATIWLTEWAPEPRDIYWRNLSIPYVELNVRRLLMAVAFFVLISFFMIPIALVQTLANIDNLKKALPFLEPIIEKQQVKSVIQGFLPGIALKIFLAILPMILMLMSKIEGYTSLSSLDRRSAAKYYLFILINMFLGNIVAGTAFEQLEEFTSQASSEYLKTIGRTMPMKGTFFITYIMVDGWSGIAAEIIRLVPLALYHFKNTFLVKTEEDREEAMNPGSLAFATNEPRIQFYMLLGLVYSVVTPLLLPFILIFFAFAYVVFRHQIINVYDQKYESGAAFWPRVHMRVIIGLIVSQVLVIGLFSTLDVQYSTYILIPQPILTFWFYRVCKGRFEPAFVTFPLQDAMVKDTVERATEPTLNLLAYLRDAYVHPDFKGGEMYKPEAIDEEERNPLVPTKRTSQMASQTGSKHESEGSEGPFLKS